MSIALGWIIAMFIVVFLIVFFVLLMIFKVMGDKKTHKQKAAIGSIIVMALLAYLLFYRSVV